MKVLDMTPDLTSAPGRTVTTLNYFNDRLLPASHELRVPAVECSVESLQTMQSFRKACHGLGRGRRATDGKDPTAADRMGNAGEVASWRRERVYQTGRT